MRTPTKTNAKHVGSYGPLEKASSTLQRSDFFYELPEELIATRPLEQRSASRLLALNGRTGSIQHLQFSRLAHLLDPGDLLVFNDTRVIPARLYGRKATGGKVEILIERVTGDHSLLAHVRASKAPKAGTEIYPIGRSEQAFTPMPDEAKLAVEGRDGDLFLLTSSVPVALLLDQCGHMPLPPYLSRSEEPEDRERYQTIFAQKSGAVAAPTAGLHFDLAFMNELAERRVESTRITLHVGAGTFQPVRADNLNDHKMHKEWLEVSAQTCAAIEATKKRGGRVVAVGTTSVRSLETAAQSGRMRPYTGETELFIYPGFRFHVVDAMITNFHLPESTLLMLVSAFSGREEILAAYRAAVHERYRFFSYGDAMFLTPKTHTT